MTLLRPTRRRLRIGGATTVAPFAVLVVVGLAIALFVLVRAAAGRVTDARESSEVAMVSSSSIEVLATAYRESGLGALFLVSGDSAMLEEYRATASSTDAAVSAFQEARAEAPRRVAAVFDQASGALAALQQIRASVSVRDAGDDSNLYAAVVAPMREALGEAAFFTQNASDAETRRAIARLVGVVDALAARRDLIVELIARREPPSREEETQLILIGRDLAFNRTEGADLLEGEARDMVESLDDSDAGGAAESALRTILEDARAGIFMTSHRDWFDVATAQLEEVVDVTAVLGDDIEERAVQGVLGSRRAVTLTSLLLGGLLALSVLAAIGAINATRGRITALHEHGELVAGLLRWFGTESRPAIAGIESEVRYVPSAAYAGAGGDWYDLFIDGTGALALVVGDVAGHGSRAVAHMAETRNVLRGLGQAAIGGPARQLELVDQTIELADLTTLLYAVLAADGESLLYSRAGHLPGIIRRADGSTELLGEGSDPPLGIGFEGPRTEASVTFDPGDLIVLFTDGLVEAPGSDLLESIEATAAFIASHGDGDLAALADGLVARRPHRADEDDLSLLIVRRDQGARSLQIELVQQPGDLEDSGDR